RRTSGGGAAAVSGTTERDAVGEFRLSERERMREPLGAHGEPERAVDDHANGGGDPASQLRIGPPRRSGAALAESLSPHDAALDSGKRRMLADLRSGSACALLVERERHLVAQIHGQRIFGAYAASRLELRRREPHDGARLRKTRAVRPARRVRQTRGERLAIGVPPAACDAPLCTLRQFEPRRRTDVLAPERLDDAADAAV